MFVTVVGGVFRSLKSLVQPPSNNPAVNTSTFLYIDDLFFTMLRFYRLKIQAYVHTKAPHHRQRR